MKILIIANGYPTDKEPQWGCFEKDQALALQRLGHDVCIMYIDGRFRMEKRKIGVNHFYDKGLSVYGIFWFPFVLISKLKINLKLKLKQRMLCSLYKKMVKTEGKPDIIYAHYLYNITNASILKEKFDIPLVGIEHWSVLNQPILSDSVKYCGRATYHKIDKLLTVSNALSCSIEKHFRQKSIVVNNMVGDEFLAQTIIKKTQDAEMFKFVAIGSLISRKGFDILINAFNKARLCENKCKLIIIGGGEEQTSLQSQIDSLRLSNSISLVGRKNKQEIISYLQESNVFVLSSHVETFSVVCIEAMALGVPVVATSCGGPEEFISEEVGLLVKPGDADDLAKAMNEMYYNYQNYDRKNIRNICKQKFAPEVIAQQLTSIFEEVVSEQQFLK